LHRVGRDAIGRGVVDVAAVGLELEGNAAAREDVEERPRVRRAQRLAAAECDIGNPGGDDALREVQRFGGRELVAPGLIGAGFLAAGDATGAATVGQLPRDEEGRPVLLDRTPRQCGRNLR
jgi:hypothetical protein